MSDLRLTPTGLWAFGRRMPCVIGRGGLRVDKYEGDGATPVGTHRILRLLYRPDRVAPPQPWAEPIGHGDLWCDSPDSPEYNQWVRRPFADHHENLHRPDPLYDIVFVTDYNYPRAKPGKGSAIFIHQWRRPGYPTEGCIALSRTNLAYLAKRITPGTRLWVPKR